MRSGIGNNYSDLVGFVSRSPRTGRSGYFGVKASPRSVFGNISNGNATGHTRKSRLRKQSEALKKETPVYKKPNLNHTEYAYREAVNRLKCMLADSYSPSKSPFRKHGYESDDTDNVSVLERPALSEISKYVPQNNVSRYNSVRRFYSPHSYLNESSGLNAIKPAESLSCLQPTTQYTSSAAPAQAPTELITFIEKQEGYIEQLERESQFCRGELNNILEKVKDVISENEALTEQAKLGLPRSDSSESGSNDFEYRSVSKERRNKQPLSGPNIVFESRISELEAQLAQADMDVKRLAQENSTHKLKLAGTFSEPGGADVYRRQVENLQRDKKSLEETVRKLQDTIEHLKENDAQHFSKSLRNRDLVEQSSFEKAQADIEIRRLKDELERQHVRVREVQHEMSKKIAEERSIVERRYNYQVDQLGGDLSCQWETASRLQLELERQKRIETDYRRDLSQKNAQIDELRSELKQKTASLLSDVAQVNAEKQSLEQEITSLRLQLERAERQAKVEASRLNAEIISLRQRLDRADSDLLNSKRENLRLSDQVASLEKEITLGDLNRETRPSKELTKLMSDMEAKHVATVSELEGMVQGQRQLMEKLTAECKTLTQKLEDTTVKHKEEMNTLQYNVEYLTNKISNNNDRINNDKISSYEQDDSNPAQFTIPTYSQSAIDSVHQSSASDYDIGGSITTSTADPVRITDTGGGSGIQSRRGSRAYELPEQQSSQEYFTGRTSDTADNAGTGDTADTVYDSDGEKYAKELIETEKPKSRSSTEPTYTSTSVNPTLTSTTTAPTKRRESTVRFKDLPEDKLSGDEESPYDSNGRNTVNAYPQQQSTYGSSDNTNDYRKSSTVEQYGDDSQQYQTGYNETFQPSSDYGQSNSGYDDQYGQQQYDASQYDASQYGGNQEYDQQQYDSSQQQYNTNQQYDQQQYDPGQYGLAQQQSDQYGQQQYQPQYEPNQQYSGYDTGSYGGDPAQQYVADTSATESYASNTNVGTKYPGSNGNGNGTARNGNGEKPKLLSKQLSKKKL